MSVCLRQGCREGVTEDGKRQPQEIGGSDRYCLACSDLIGRHLAQLRDLYDDAEDMLGGRTGAGPKISGSREAPIPIDLGIRALQEDLIAALLEVEDSVRDQRNYTTRVFQGNERQTLHATVRFLSSNLEWLLHRDTVEYTAPTRDGNGQPRWMSAGNLIDELWRGLRRALGQSKVIHRLDVPCPGCDQKALVREDGSDIIRCRNETCGRISTATDPWWLRVTAS